MQAFDDDRKDDDVLAEEHRVEQSLFQSSNQASIKSSNSATCYAYTCCNEFPAISKGNAVSNRSQVILTLKEGGPECRSDRITLARMPQSTTAYFTLTGHRRGDVFLCLYCQDSWEMIPAGCICRCTAMVRWNSPC